ncbi:GtrA family protein [Amphibiibacter pelophylacis]|uniref:GtrA family protein n=1 Tax=Amphibiibacter pelophylacis TaxID=1799477 RepID=A0ACC6P4B8_9BURK
MSAARRASALWFVAVGAGAAATHLAVFTLLRRSPLAAPGRSPVPVWAWPETHNALAFAVAFAVSYLGHRHLSFADTTQTAKDSLPRFAATALLGLLANEVWFVLLHRLIGWSDTAALLAAMVLVAGQTWVLGRLWAFRR